ncbi:MAG: DUF6120 family protein [Lachnospiraceae bacterium]|nr:DUF6120 family protein [Lachnospiraceae bacterium]
MQQVKAAFPVLGKPEKQYLQKLQACVQSFVEERPDLTLNDLIEEFGPAKDVFALYASGCDTASLVRRMQIAHWRYVSFILLIMFFLLVLMIFFILMYRDFNLFREESIAYMNEIIATRN